MRVRLVLAALILGLLGGPAPSRACDSSAAESMVRMRVQSELAKYPNLYGDILQGRFAPTKPGWYNGNSGGQSPYSNSGQSTSYLPYGQTGANYLPSGQVPQYGQNGQVIYQQTG